MGDYPLTKSDLPATILLYNVGRIPLHDTATIISAANKTFKTAHIFLKCVIIYWKATKKKNYELVSKAKTELHLFQQYFTPHTSLPKQGESETALHPQSRHPQHTHHTPTIPFRKCFQSCSPMSDLVTRYGPQATTRCTCLVLDTFEHEPSKSECR